MTIIIFIIILLTLVLIHEAGHFFAAKMSKVRVDEFAFGFPPRLYSVKKGETRYIINSLPLGGYVKIHGENGEGINDDRGFVKAHPIKKIIMLSAGVIMNILLAFILVTVSVFNGTTFQVDGASKEYQKFIDEGRVRKEFLVVTAVAKDTPAYNAGIKSGYIVKDIFLNEENLAGKVSTHKALDLKRNTEEVVKDISNNLNGEGRIMVDSLTIVYREPATGEVSSTTLAGVYRKEGEDNKKIIGVSFGKFADIHLTFFECIKIGGEKTLWMIEETIIGFVDLLKNIFTKGEVSKDVAGPVRIFALVKEARGMGINYILIFSAVLSISLAVFNILPFPALDGGRILFVIIESITRRKISEKWQTILNGAGFLILILLMIAISVRDVINLF
jgi:regulator of sigma E protease